MNHKIWASPDPKGINKMINYLFKNVSLYIIQRICVRVIEACEWRLYNVPDRFKTQEIYNKAVEEDPWRL